MTNSNAQSVIHAMHLGTAVANHAWPLFIGEHAFTAGMIEGCSKQPSAWHLWWPLIVVVIPWTCHDCLHFACTARRGPATGHCCRAQTKSRDVQQAPFCEDNATLVAADTIQRGQQHFKFSQQIAFQVQLTDRRRPCKHLRHGWCCRCAWSASSCSGSGDAGPCTCPSTLAAVQLASLAWSTWPIQTLHCT